MEFSQSTLIAGKSGTGKSYLAGHHLERETNFVVLLDKKNDHEDLAEHLGYVKLTINERVLDRLSPVQMEKIFRMVRRRRIRGIRIVPDKLATRYEDLGNLVSRAVLEMRKVTLAVEELKNYAPDRTSRDDIKSLLNVVSEGRSQDVRLLGTTQFPQQLHYMIYYNCNLYHVFYLGKRERNYEKFTDNKELIGEMKKAAIEDRKYIYIDDNQGVEEIRDSKGIDRRSIP
ncbi:MAG: hypothetical protein ABEJ71_02660 [Halodesulfurarchaeum sp.]